MSKSAFSTSESIAATIFFLPNVPPVAYRLPGDGKKWRHSCEQRRSLLGLLASKGNRDGTNIYPGRKSMAKALGLSLRDVDYYLADLRTLKFLHDDGWPTAVKTLPRRAS